MWTQALHWLAVLVTMNIMLFSGVQQLLPTLATSLVLLILLALGTFVAGVHLLSLQVGFLGLALALAVPAISWVKQSALFLLLVAAVFFIGLAMAFWSYWGDAHPANSGAGRPRLPIGPRPTAGREPMTDGEVVKAPALSRGKSGWNILAAPATTEINPSVDKAYRLP